MRPATLIFFAGLVAAAAPASAADCGKFDTLILGGQVIDGTGTPAFRADVGVRGDKIAAVGDLACGTAMRRIDASGKYVTPGFIDIHSHAFDFVAPTGMEKDRKRLAAPSFASQGVTTVVINQDGRSPWPIRDQAARLQRNGIGLNTILLIGHGAVRARVMGDDHKRLARPDEIAKMQALVREGMRDGAFGMSAGLEYIPGRWSNTDEVTALTRELVPFRGVYISHQRSEGSDPLWYWPSQDGPDAPTAVQAVRETIEIGEKTGAVVVASHIKVKGAHLWGRAGELVSLIDAARTRGVKIYADQYPYNTTGTDGATVLIPAWALSPGATGFAAESVDDGPGKDFRESVGAVLRDPARAAQLRQDVAHEIRRRGGADNILVLDHRDKNQVGETLRSMATKRGIDDVEMALLMQMEDGSIPGGARLRGFSMSPRDLDTLATPSWMATASDGLTVANEAANVGHPRFYGTFPRKIRHYALDRKIMSLEAVIRSSTSLPAEIMGLNDRGTLRPDTVADIVVFDPATITDLATAEQPNRYSRGVEWVLVNGQPVVEASKVTHALAGKVLLSPSAAAARRK